MSKHNYSQYSKKGYTPKKPDVETLEVKMEVEPRETPAVVMPVVEPRETPAVVMPVVEPRETSAMPVVERDETPAMPVVEPRVTPAMTMPVVEIDEAPITGTIFNCSKLNVRANPNPNAEILCVLNAGSEVAINRAGSNKEWFKVTTASGVDGYCMRQFVDANL